MNKIIKLTAATLCGLALAACGGSGFDGANYSGGASSDTGGNSSSGDGGSANNGGDTGGGASGGQTTYTVTPSMNTGGAAGGNTISPAGAVTVASGASATFTLTPSPGYAVSGVGGTCGGSWSGNTYTTNPVTADCTVAVTFAKVTVTGSIAACFTAPNSVSFALTPYAVNAGYPVKSTIGPEIFNGQATTAQTFFFNDETQPYTDYWAVTINGVSLLGEVKIQSGTTWTPNPPLVFPLNMQPGQSVDYVDPDNNVPVHVTFMGFETLTLAGKTFSNTCHFMSQRPLQPNGYVPTSENWNAPGYGSIKSTWSPGNVAYQYAGDL